MPQSYTGHLRIAKIAAIFLRLGLTSFGGPAAHIAFMRHEFVHRRGWLSQSEFLDRVGAANLIPGPNSTEVAMQIGYRRAGLPGLLAAGVCFILPSAALTYLLAVLYRQFGSLPQAAALLHGVQPVILVIVLQATVKLARAALRSTASGAIAASALFAATAGFSALPTLAFAGSAAGFIHWLRSTPRSRWAAAALILAPALALAAALAPHPPHLAADAPRLPVLFAYFLKLGSIVYGSGYVLFGLLQSDLVDRFQWLSASQLLDAVAAGQVTPGPVFTAATFLGYTLAGPSGALAATVGIFLPAFAFSAAIGPLVPRLRQSALAAAVLNGVNAASLALLAAVALHLARAAIQGYFSAALALACAFGLARTEWNPSWFLAAGAVAGAAAPLLVS